MDEIEVVIKMPKNTYRQIQALARNNYFEHDICGNSMRRIANGIPLPKGHGSLIDADKVENITWQEPYYHDALNVLSEVRDKVRELPTIIEADKN